MIVEATVNVVGTVWMRLSVPDEWKQGDRLPDDEVRRALNHLANWEQHDLAAVVVSVRNET